jgi:hypothetical protein
VAGVGVENGAGALAFGSVLAAPKFGVAVEAGVCVDEPPLKSPPLNVGAGVLPAWPNVTFVVVLAGADEEVWPLPDGFPNVVVGACGALCCSFEWSFVALASAAGEPKANGLCDCCCSSFELAAVPKLNVVDG